MEEIVEEARVYAHPLPRRWEAFVEFALRRQRHYPVFAGGQQQRRRQDRTRVVHHPRGRVVHADEDVHGNRACNQRIAAVILALGCIMGEHLRLHIALDECLLLHHRLQTQEK